MKNEKKIEALKDAAERKRQDALRRTNEAINQLVKQGKRISFPSVAKEAGVSITYLYKYDELKERIEYLRNQQAQTISQPTKPQPATDNSKATIIYNLKQEINKLRTENKGLRDQVEMVYGRLHTMRAAEQELEVLKAENTKLLAEINSLKQQLAQQAQSNHLQTNSTSSKEAKLVVLDKKSSTISNKVKLELAEIGIELNTTLSKTIKAASEELVLGAIKALKEAMNNGVIQKPGGWLNKAIKDGWKPNEAHFPQDKATQDIFKEWFELAYKHKLVLASTKGDDGQMYVFTIDGLRLSFEQMLAEYPLEELRLSLLKI